MSYFADG